MKRTIAKVVGLGMLAGMFAFAAPKPASADTHFSLQVGTAPRGVLVQQRFVQPRGPYYGARYNQRVWERAHWGWAYGRRAWIPGHWVYVGGGRYDGRYYNDG